MSRSKGKFDRDTDVIRSARDKHRVRTSRSEKVVAKILVKGAKYQRDESK